MSTRRSILRKTDVAAEKQISIKSDEENVGPRRSCRKVKKSVKLLSESSEEENEEMDEDIELNEDEDKIFEETEAEKQSKVLFEDQDVAGKKMFGFQTPKKRGGLVQRVNEALNSPMSLNTPKKIEQASLPAKTPHSIRNKMKKELGYLIRENESSTDFSDSGSEYHLSDTSSSKSEDENTSDESGESSDEKIEKPHPYQRLASSSNTTRGRKDLTYHMKTEEYFASHGNSKTVTSNHTLQKLKNPKFSEDQLQELLDSCHLNIPSAHEFSIKDLFESSTGEFHKWMNVLNEGFSVLLYGLGSKRNILGQFQKELLAAKYPVIVVNGYFPSLTIKDILDGILMNILEHNDNLSNVYDAFDVIKDDFMRMPNLHLYLIVHNLDGSMLRNNKSQNILASLAAIPNFHLVASIDHINTPLIWDHSKLSKFNFTWWDATSLLPYTDETSFESSLLVQKSGALVLSSISSVYQSLTKNSKGIFMLIVKHQLIKREEKHYQGMPFKVLYSQCRENFLVSSDLALRAQLTEFLDHKLVKSRRTADGTEQLIIPIHNSILQQFSEQVSNISV